MDQGFAATFVVIFLNIRLFRWIEADVKNRDITFVLIGLVVIAALIIYITVKPYPMDYADGVLLVDPEKMKPDTFEAIGDGIGFLAGWLIERRFIRFENPKNRKKLL